MNIMTKIKKIIIISFITLNIFPFFSITNKADSSSILDITEIDITNFFNLTVLNEFEVKIDMIQYYSFNKTFIRNMSNVNEFYSKEIPLGINISLDNGKFIRTDEVKAETSQGNLKIISINDSTLITESINEILKLNDSIFFKLSYYCTGIIWGVSSINLFRIPINIHLLSRNISNQQLNVKIALPYKSEISKNQEKYITFYGYSLGNAVSSDENFIDKMLSSNPLTIFFSKNQIGTEVTLFPFIDYYFSEIPKIIINCSQELNIIDSRIIENMMICNKGNRTLYLAYNESKSNFPFYTIINEAEIQNYVYTNLIPSTNGSYYNLYSGKKISINPEKKDCSIFKWNKSSFPFESYEISDFRQMKIPLNSTKSISFLVNFNLDLDTMNLFEVDQQQSYYSIIPTIIKIPPIFGENSELIKEQSYIRFSEFNKDASGVRFLIDIVPKEFHGNLNMSIYRLYSSWCSAGTNKIIKNSSSYYTLQGTDFTVDTLQNEITINYFIKYSTKQEIQWACYGLWLFTPFLILGPLLSLPKSKNQTKKYIKLIIFIGILATIIFTSLQIRPNGYPFTFFDSVIILEIFFCGMIYSKKDKIIKKPICPNCGTNTYVRKRITKKPKWICDKCKFEFETNRRFR